jgi:very-short-patch-repair endonuclease
LTQRQNHSHTQDYGELFGRLCRYYLDCIDEEDSRGLRFRLDQLNRSYISPFDGEELLLSPPNPTLEFKLNDKPVDRWMNQGAIQAGGKEQLFYGYPFVIDASDSIAPLFFIEVQMEITGPQSYRLLKQDTGGIHLNHHVFKNHRFSSEELSYIQRELEAEFGSFEARVRRAVQILGANYGNLSSARIAALPRRGSGRIGLVNRPFLFRSQRSLFNIHLGRELSVLSRYKNLQSQVLGTSLERLIRSTPNFTDVSEDDDSRILEVAPLDAHQRAATDSGLSQPLTVITGPPGTGKSQVVIDLLASSALSNRSVLFVSKNNKAVDVVRERLSELLTDESDWSMRLGSMERVNETRRELFKRIEALDNVPDSKDAIASARERMTSSTRKVDRIMDKSRDFREFDTQLREAEIEKLRLESQLPSSWTDTLGNDGIEAEISLDFVRDKTEVDALAGESPIGLLLGVKKFLLGERLIHRLYSKFVEHIQSVPDPIRTELASQLLADLSAINLSTAFARVSLYYQWLKMEKRHKKLFESLLSMPTSSQVVERLEIEKSELSESSSRFLALKWTDGLAASKNMVVSAAHEYFRQAQLMRSPNDGKNFKSLLRSFTSSVSRLQQHFPIWVMTNLSAGRSLPLQPGLFDLVIIDEASQCDIASAIPLLFRAKRAVIIGDPQQLRHISNILPELEESFARKQNLEGMRPLWSYSDSSIYDLGSATTTANGSPPIFLSDHYRSHPDIIEFSNQALYESSLLIRTDISALLKKFTENDLGIFWHEVLGNVPEDTGSPSNPNEVTAAMSLLGQWVRNGLLDDRSITVGIVTPFRRQSDLIQRSISHQPWSSQIYDQLTVGTAHQFQGDQCDLMIFSPVVAKGMRKGTRQWLSSTDQLLNVAVTRARAALHVVGDSNSCEEAGGLLGEFAKYSLSSDRGEVDRRTMQSPAEGLMVDILNDLHLWFRPQFQLDRYVLDFLVVSPFGTRYDIEIDGRETHQRSSTIEADRLRDDIVGSKNIRVIRIPASLVHSDRVAVSERLSRLG